MRAVGVFGGTFDPIHFGHLRAALELSESLSLDELRLVPASVPPHRGEPTVPAAKRLEMVRAAAADSGFLVDERELRRDGPSYMVDTLQSLREELGEVSLCLLLGMDAFLGLPAWHRWERLPELAHLVVAHRPGWRLEEVRREGNPAVALLERRRQEPSTLHNATAGGIVLQPVTPLAISATAIRELIRAGRSPRFLIPEAVWHIIERDNLYR